MKKDLDSKTKKQILLGIKKFHRHNRISYYIVDCKSVLEPLKLK